jgi:pSer/pThr/pTyr-binding forkhead associated (FHA) protein
LGLVGVLLRARLVSLDGGSFIDLVKDLTVVGRDEDCDLRLDHKSVSKLHCVIVKTDGLLLIRDLGSTNGTRVNGQRVRRAALLPNDTLSVANLKFQVKFGADLEKENAPESPGGRNDIPEIPIRRNALPDVYPESKIPKNP